MLSEFLTVYHSLVVFNNFSGVEPRDDILIFYRCSSDICIFYGCTSCIWNEGWSDICLRYSQLMTNVCIKEHWWQHPLSGFRSDELAIRKPTSQPLSYSRSGIWCIPIKVVNYIYWYTIQIFVFIACNNSCYISLLGASHSQVWMDSHRGKASLKCGSSHDYYHSPPISTESNLCQLYLNWLPIQMFDFCCMQ